MQTPKARNNSTEAPQKISPRVVRQLKTTTIETAPTSSSNGASKTPKDRSPKVTERKSPRSPASEKKHPSRISELQSQISQLQEDLKKAKDELSSSESSKRKAEEDAEDSKKQLISVSSELEESQKQLLEISAANEIQQLKDQLQLVAESDAEQTKRLELSNEELQAVKENLAESLSLVEDMKTQLSECKESEAQAQELVGETLLQLETAKMTIETLRLDGFKAKEAYNCLSSDLDQSRARVEFLEGLIGDLNASGDNEIECEITEVEKKRGKSMELEAELASVKAELIRLRTALETAEIRYHEEQIQSTIRIRSADEMAERIKSASSLRETELEEEVNKTKAEIEELKANLMDKETELQGISEENEALHMKLGKNILSQREFELEKELKKLKENVEDLKGNLMDKETELQHISQENEMLKSEIKGRETDKGKANNEIFVEVEAARAAEREALMKLGYMTEEADKSSRRAARVAEQLAAAQAVTSEMETELRRLKVQSDQWRKAAEAAASILSTGNNGNFVGRGGKYGSPESEDNDDDLLKKKNGNVLKKFGVLWKKPQQK
ncbi:interactor of constitutive active ROPs 3 isoform X2 [Rhododendron vialii]|uniref:interactor of constitutive active ROPs 3 isoform X2 n=1 Tax=Rhododendron vialii TaxID=182163 RepID=UPI00265DFE80|nr:interactor of constitutive active ROPs 3 isoform X2 [Rhododendron vialii]